MSDERALSDAQSGDGAGGQWGVRRADGRSKSVTVCLDRSRAERAATLLRELDVDPELVYRASPAAAWEPA